MPDSLGMLRRASADPSGGWLGAFLIEFWPFWPLFLFFITSMRGFQDASTQGTEGLAMEESKLVKMPLHGSQRV